MKQIILISIAILLLVSCNKDENSSSFTVSTGEATELNGNKIIISGKLRLDNGNVQEYGHCWSKFPNPTIESDDYTNHGSSNQTTEYLSELVNLSPATIYYIRSYAKEKEVVYGNEIAVLTPNFIVNSTIIDENNIDAVKLVGSITTFNDPIVSFGFCWAEHNQPSIYDNKKTFNNLHSSGYFGTEIDFGSNSTYFVRSFGQSSQLAYGPVIKVNQALVEFIHNSAMLLSNGSIKLQSSIKFENNEDIRYGHCWSTDNIPTISDNYTEYYEPIVNQSRPFTSLLDTFPNFENCRIRSYFKLNDTIIYSGTFKIDL